MAFGTAFYAIIFFNSLKKPATDNDADAKGSAIALPLHSCRQAKNCNVKQNNVKNTLKCLSIGTLKTIDIPYIPNGKLMFLDVPVFRRIIIGL